MIVEWHLIQNQLIVLEQYFKSHSNYDIKNSFGISENS